MVRSCFFVPVKADQTQYIGNGVSGWIQKNMKNNFLITKRIRKLFLNAIYMITPFQRSGGEDFFASLDGGKLCNPRSQPTTLWLRGNTELHFILYVYAFFIKLNSSLPLLSANCKNFERLWIVRQTLNEMYPTSSRMLSPRMMKPLVVAYGEKHLKIVE